MSGSNKHMLVPQLRFPEFRNAEEWTTYNLGQLSKIVTERVGNDDCIPYTITSGVGLISQQEKLGRTIAGNSLKITYSYSITILLTIRVPQKHTRKDILHVTRDTNELLFPTVFSLVFAPPQT
ncbi:hypothetical protein [Enterobacter cloacae]|uniref:hypothetical protein n=1 Tax=Enterobacter cloacae TaxID=550 RepID=UPI00388D6C5E